MRRLKTTLGLLLVPDLHRLARNLKEIDHGLDVAHEWVAKAEYTLEVSGGPTLVALSEAKDAIVESRARLIENIAVLTGRRAEPEA